jgi:GTP pyrophosphokinase
MSTLESWTTWSQAQPRLAERLPPAAVSAVHDAFEFAAAFHAAQRRPAGEPYAEHLFEVLEILVCSAGVSDPEVLTAAVLHDVVEDTPCTLEEVAARFGERVAGLVDRLTKPEPPPGGDGAATRHAYLERIAAGPEDVRTIKLADRYSNVWKLDTHPRPGKQRSYYAETCRYVLPLAAGVPPFEQMFAAWRDRFRHLEEAGPR